MKPNELRNKINERNWERLLDAIENKRVVPILGENLIHVATESGNRDIRSYLLNNLSEQFSEEQNIRDFSQIEIDIHKYNTKGDAGDETDIYYEIFQQLKEASVTLPDQVVKLFQICNFPLVLTTSYAPRINDVLGISENNVKVYQKKKESDISSMNHGLKNSTILYHLFGKVNAVHKSFLVTDEDLLDYLHCWHNQDTRPPVLEKYLKDKFFLVLGCNYPNWLFRFFWHSIKNFSIAPTSDLGMQGVVALDQHHADDQELIGFLSRIKTITVNNTEDFIGELIERYQLRNKDKVITSKSDNIESDTQKHDIFISYASEDFEIAKEIYNLLKSLGANPWFDKKKLEGGELYERTIDKQIKECKRFMPILSQNTLTNERRFFKKEWTHSIEELPYRYGTRYICPIVIDNINPFEEDRIPDQFKQCHVINSNSSDLTKELETIIRSYRK